jgi:uncharacterized membrane protein YoaK (UPF0700 family)
MAPTVSHSGPARESRQLVIALLALTFTTGLVDAVSLLGLGRVFTANMTGNVVLLGFALGVEVALVLLAAILATGLTPSTDTDLRYVVIALLAAAMGARNAAVRALGVRDLSTTVLTMTLTGLAADSRLAGGTGSGGGRRVAAVASMLVGAVAGGLLVADVDLSLPLYLAAAVAAANLGLLAAVSSPRPSPEG